eukprot:CAMPEP_0177250326 /NCGR_PEP_ID=MMETSP0367-20130122/53284_1 /TAXON_ID=447022 ORGANISM="Scrippsiella hangoei-like, Strain SHHI-4" /NCGR_SAMPLE_ID=MMETSP0367 /ASSEMBLY_ACC=CAM_ASM_000362 /LENGTH=224 /DNA_ID=CAMNT_0018703007 /DNA_START=91 /DNA_END=762 /DNA_ORIENTATION=-
MPWSTLRDVHQKNEQEQVEALGDSLETRSPEPNPPVGSDMGSRKLTLQGFQAGLWEKTDIFTGFLAPGWLPGIEKLAVGCSHRCCCEPSLRGILANGHAAAGRKVLLAHRTVRRARAFPPAFAARHPLHGLLDEFFHAVEAVVIVVAGVLHLGPLRRGGGGASEAADHVDGRQVGRSRLEDLHAAGHAHVALAELAALVEPQRADEGRPANLGARGHGLVDDLA